MPWNLPDGLLDDTHTWQNAQDRVEFQRAFDEGPYQKRLMAKALITAFPGTPEEEIAQNLTVPGVPDRFGYDQHPVSTDDIFSSELPDPHLADGPPTKFSGGNGEYSGSDIPSLPWF